jgi:hypothetical protein
MKTGPLAFREPRIAAARDRLERLGVIDAQGNLVIKFACPFGLAKALTT